MQHSTHELQLIRRYSKLVNQLTAENEVLREELIKARRLAELHYESKCRWQLKYEQLEAKKLAYCKG